MPITPTDKIWMNGTLVDWDDATVHVLNPTHALRLGRLRGHPGVPRRPAGRPSSG